MSGLYIKFKGTYLSYIHCLLCTVSRWKKEREASLYIVYTATQCFTSVKLPNSAEEKHGIEVQLIYTFCKPLIRPVSTLL